MKKTALILSMFVLAVLLLVMPASADTINLVLSNPVQSGAPGSTLSFDATVSAPLANAATVYLNGDSFDITIPGSNPIDDSGFLFNFPLSLDPGDTFTGTLFSVTLPSDLALGTYNGFFTITGGGPADLNNLATVNFQVNSAVPEPGTWALLATGLGILAMAISRRRPLTQTITT